MSDIRPKDRPPHNVNVLSRWLTEAAQQSGLAPVRLRRWLGFMIVAAMLDGARHRDDGEPLFLIKGGVAMQLRFDIHARATKDIDTALRGPISGADDELDTALRAGFGDFTAKRTELEPIRDTGSVRGTIRISYKNRPVVSVPIEIAETEASMGSEPDHVRAQPLDHVGLQGPETVPCISVRWQIAQKLHACTERFGGTENGRFRDLLDLLLLETLIADAGWPEVRAACVEIFDQRDAHPWPPLLTVPPTWREGFATLAHDTGFAVTDVDDAADRVRDLISRIDTA